MSFLQLRTSTQFSSPEAWSVLLGEHHVGYLVMSHDRWLSYDLNYDLYPESASLSLPALDAAEELFGTGPSCDEVMRDVGIGFND